MKLNIDSWGGIRRWNDAAGDFSPSDFATDDMAVPGFRLIRYDDAWRPLGSEGASPLVSDLEQGVSTVEFEDVYGGERRRAYGANPKRGWPSHWPAAFDAWPYAGDLHPHAPMRFSGRLTTEPVQSLDATGTRFSLTIRDLRNERDGSPQHTLRLGVGIELPLPPRAVCYGTEEIFEHYKPMLYRVDDPEMRRAWYYLEGELFGMRLPRPEAVSWDRPYQHCGDAHMGSPLAAFSGDSNLWWAVASEPDYGAAALWGRDRLRYFTTLYLRPGGEASWSWIVWRSECREPSSLVLQCTRKGGLFDLLNPRDFTPKGAPAGPVIFANVSRLPFQLEQIRALQPGLVLLNYHYDHISSTANLYGDWTTYEGFRYSEAKLKKLIADVRAAGVPMIGVYGTQVEQPESHKVLRQDDIVQDAWGRRFHAWEPGNWVVDGGNRDCGERLARAEAEFCRHYGLDAVFVDRLDHMGINANPARIGKPGDQRLECVPSIRLGMIELNRQRMAWMRKLNPRLFVGLNNTTGWAGVRYSDWNQLEGGNCCNREIPWLYQPAGVVDKRHTTPLFGPPSGPDLFQVMGNQRDEQAFPAIMRQFIGESLLGGVEASPYGDEWFVDPDSMFFSGSNSKGDPDEVKLAKIRAVEWGGGAEWRAMWEIIRPALEASRSLATPPARVVNQPDEGTLPAHCQLHARAGDGGGIYVAVRNRSDVPVRVTFGFHGYAIAGEVAGNAVRVWWGEAAPAGCSSVMHLLGPTQARETTTV